MASTSSDKTPELKEKSNINLTARERMRPQDRAKQYAEGLRIQKEREQEEREQKDKGKGKEKEKEKFEFFTFSDDGKRQPLDLEKEQPDIVLYATDDPKLLAGARKMVTTFEAARNKFHKAARTAKSDLSKIKPMLEESIRGIESIKTIYGSEIPEDHVCFTLEKDAQDMMKSFKIADNAVQKLTTNIEGFYEFYTPVMDSIKAKNYTMNPETAMEYISNSKKAAIDENNLKGQHNACTKYLRQINSEKMTINAEKIKAEKIKAEKEAFRRKEEAAKKKEEEAALKMRIDNERLISYYQQNVNKRGQKFDKSKFAAWEARLAPLKRREILQRH